MPFFKIQPVARYWLNGLPGSNYTVSWFDGFEAFLGS